MFVSGNENRRGAFEVRARRGQIAQRHLGEAEEEMGGCFTRSIALRDERITCADEMRVRLGRTPRHHQLSDTGEWVAGERRFGCEQCEARRKCKCVSQETRLRD
jgi:hypothetical protein